MGDNVRKARKFTKEEWIKKFKKIHGNRYDYSLVNYTGCFNPIKIIYEGQVYTQKPSQHLIGMRCERDTIKSQEDFIRKAIERHGSKYDYSLEIDLVISFQF